MNFEELWRSVAVSRYGSFADPELKPLLHALHDTVLAVPVDLARLKSSLITLLEYLSSTGRTDANCHATDYFISSDHWDPDWSDQNLPEDFHDLLARMGEALHDTVRSPEIAENFGCLPEQLLEQAKQLRA